jgi:hypothetical protein
VFDLPFDTIAPIVGRSPNTAAQLAARARRRVRGQTPDSNLRLAHQRQVVDAFLAAAATVTSTRSSRSSTLTSYCTSTARPQVRMRR